MKRKTLLWIVVMTSVVLLTACTSPETPPPTIFSPIPDTLTPTPSQTPEPSSTLTPNPTENAQATLSANATNNAAHYETSVVAMTATALVRLTITPIPNSSLTSREPTIKQLESFLGIRFGYAPDGVTIEAEFFYLDVTGDGEKDLVVHTSPLIYVLMWEDDHYLQIYSDIGAFLRGFPRSQVLLEDWTGDGIPEIIFDNRKLEGGTEHDIYDVRRKMIHCQDAACTVVWDGTVAFQDLFYGFGASVTNEKLEMTPIAQNGQPAMQVDYSAFFLDDNAYGFSSDTEAGKVTLSIRPSKRQIYLWNGSVFELSNEQEISPAQEIDNLSVLTATNSQGQIASIIPTDPDLPYTHDICQLVIEDIPVPTEFPCAGNFSQVFWQDVTGDGVDEIVFLMLFGNIYQYGDLLNSAIPWCSYQQQMIIYPAGADAYHEIANVTGCVAGVDLFGVRLEDTNSDGLPEILASSDEWNTSNWLYQWDGTSFVLMEEVCLQTFPGYTFQCRAKNP